MSTIELQCTCGKVRLEIWGAPIVAAECCCTTCRAAGRAFEQLPGTPAYMTPLDNTQYALYRKDRVRVTSGGDLLRGHRSEPDAPTRRALAECCNTPMFLDFEKGHWLSIYAHLWPVDARPTMQLRTMCRSIEPGVTLPADMPNPATHNIAFYARLMRAWVAMGFRVPKFTIEEAAPR